MNAITTTANPAGGSPVTDDIVTRLRDNCACSGTQQFGYRCTSCTAADEVERLRAERDKFYHLARRLYDQHGKRGDEVLAEAYLLKEYEKAVEF